jgi:putative heme transporter
VNETSPPPAESPDAAIEPDTEQDAAGPAMPNRRTAILRTGVIVGVLVVVFGIILPRFVDYEEVFAALGALTPPQLVVMTILGIIAWFVSGLLYVVVVPGLTALRGMAAYLILSGIGASVPFGPWNMGVVWVILRGWGVTLQNSTTGIALYGVINTLGRFALPLVAIVFIAATGELGGTGNTAAKIISLISIAIFFVVGGLMLAVVRSDRLANWVGRTADHYVTLLLGRLRREEHPDVEGSIHRFRDSLGEVVRRRGLAGVLVNVLSQIPWMVAFIVALRFCGVPGDVITPPEVVAVFALTSVITIIPIAPGGAGVPELLYISMLSSIAPSYESAITAGVFLFRLYVWFLPIPLAWILLKIVRRGRPMLPTTTELRAYTSTST